MYIFYILCIIILYANYIYTVSDTAPVSDDRSCLAPGYCSEESLPPLQGAAQLMIFSSSVQQGNKKTCLSVENMFRS